MSDVYSSDFAPNPDSAVDVLAFILCPLSAFAPTGDADELEAVADLIGPIKEEAVRRWMDGDQARRRN